MGKNRLCMVRGCQIAVKPDRLMCYYHWKMVPGYVQKKVWAAYRPGQENEGVQSTTQEWMKAALEACDWVEKAEKAKSEKKQLNWFEGLGNET